MFAEWSVDLKRTTEDTAVRTSGPLDSIWLEAVLYRTSGNVTPLLVSSAALTIGPTGEATDSTHHCRISFSETATNTNKRNFSQRNLICTKISSETRCHVVRRRFENTNCVRLHSQEALHVLHTSCCIFVLRFYPVERFNKVLRNVGELIGYVYVHKHFMHGQFVHESSQPTETHATVKQETPRPFVTYWATYKWARRCHGNLKLHIRPLVSHCEPSLIRLQFIRILDKPDPNMENDKFSSQFGACFNPLEPSGYYMYHQP
jgi:hypothetical protein